MAEPHQTSSQPVVLISGASSGIGQATARELATHGYTVYATMRQPEPSDTLPYTTLALDVTSAESIQNCIAIIMKQEGRLDILINNAGYGVYGSLEETPMADAKQQFDVNVFGLAALTKAVLPIMRAQQSGTIVMLSSIAGKVSFPFGGWYHASKHAVEALSDSLRLEVKPFGIRVIIIQPGGIKTLWSGKAMQSLLRVSGNGPYAKAAQKAHISLSVDDKSPGPDLIAKLILHALLDSRHKARYHAGYSSSIVVLRRFLPDRVLDWGIEHKLL